MTELVDSFYKGLKRSIALVLKGSTTSFSALKVVLSRSIDNIRDFGGDNQAATLELLVDRLERDVDNGAVLAIQIWSLQLMNSLRILLLRCMKLISSLRKLLRPFFLI